MKSIDELLLLASATSSPQFVEKSKIQVGGVDPLGLRQINFDLMDKVLPGLNNVAEKLRPFVIMTWAWRRVRVIIERDNLGGATDEQMRDFVDRVETIYAWSQFLIDPSSRLPGGQALSELIDGENDVYHFGGGAWEKRRNLRRSSTGLISPLNYGPGLRSMGWLELTGTQGVFKANANLEPMLDAFEACFASELLHPAFSKLGPVEVSREDVRRWGHLWRLSDLTDAERQAGFDRLAGPAANKFRREGLALIERAIFSGNDREREAGTLRRIMAAPADDWLMDDSLKPRAEAWRRLQIRQLFRLSLEAMFYWLLTALDGPPKTSAELAEEFLSQASQASDQKASVWLDNHVDGNPVEILDELDGALRARGWSKVPFQISRALNFCLTVGGKEAWDKSEAFDRLPLTRALREADQWSELPMRGFIVKIIEVWVIAQHAYWCVGRGLADARGGGKTLLRLRIFIDEGGWTLTPGTKVGGTPNPTPDRLETALSLLDECHRI